MPIDASNIAVPPECDVMDGDPSSSMSHSLRSPALAQNNRDSFMFCRGSDHEMVPCGRIGTDLSQLPKELFVGGRRPSVVPAEKRIRCLDESIVVDLG